MDEDDVFGKVSSLFEEFEKDRSSSSTFIAYDRTVEGNEDRSRIVFKIGSSDNETSDDSESENESSNKNERNLKQSDSEEDVSLIFQNGMFDESAQSVHKDNGVSPGEQKSAQTSQFKILHERNKFQRFSNIIDSTRHVPDEESPACQIIFQNNRFSRLYRAEIEAFLYHLLQKDAMNCQRIKDLQLKSSVPTCVDINSKLSASQRTDDMWNAHAIIGSSQFHRDFLIDALGWPLVADNPSLTDGWDIPRFEQVYMDPLPYDEKETVSRPSRPKQTCFNCDGDHRINDCPKPKNFQKIRENKIKFQQQNAHMQLQRQGSQRYHVEEQDNESKYTNLRPGKFSAELQEALDITSQQLPEFIYRMRILGYPPGWLEEAKSNTSGICMFDKDGKEVNLTGDSMEDGELKEDVPEEGEISADKIIEYPGFTIPTPDGIIDEHEKFGYPPVQIHQLKTTLVEQIESVKSAKKRKKEEEVERVAKKQKTETNTTMDMDVSEDEDEYLYGQKAEANRSFHPPLPVDTPPGKPPLPDGTPPPTPDGAKRKIPIPRSNSSSKTKSRSNSPSLEFLESQYKMLKEKLLENEVSSDVELKVLDSVGDDESESESNQVAELLALKSQLNREDSVSSIQTFGDLGEGNSVPGTPVLTPTCSATNLRSLMSKSNKSISKEYGTPIMKRPEVRESLPDASKFGDGICDHIPYENLPEATGTFNKLRGLIGKIREKVVSRKKKS